MKYQRLLFQTLSFFFCAIVAGILVYLHPGKAVVILLGMCAVFMLGILTQMYLILRRLQRRLNKEIKNLGGEQTHIVEVLSSLAQDTKLLSASTSEFAIEEKIINILEKDTAVGESPAFPPRRVAQVLTLKSKKQKNHEPQMLDQIKQALRQDNIEIMLQPVVTLPQRKIKHYECFSRLRGNHGEVILPDQYLSFENETSVIRLIDNMMLFKCLRMVRLARSSDEELKFFCNISPNSLKDDEFFENLLEYMLARPNLAPVLVFEFSEENFKGMDSLLRERTYRLAEFGSKFSLDQVMDLDMNMTQIKSQKISFLKVSIDTLLKTLNEEDGHDRVLDFKAKADKAKIPIVITHVESEKALKEVLDYHFDLGQGFLFCPPRLDPN